MQKKRFIARLSSHSRYESMLCRVGKFAYLNHLDYGDIDVLLMGDALATRPPKRTAQGVAIPLLLDADSRDPKMIEKLSEMLEISPADVPRLFTSNFCIWGHQKDKNSRHCPDCDKTGFHTAIFDLPCMKECPIHGVDLTDECPMCGKESNHNCSVTRLGALFECRKGHVLWPARDSRTWPRSITVKQEDILDGVMSFLEVTRDLVHFTNLCLDRPSENVVRFSPQIALPLAAKVIPEGCKYLERFNIDPVVVDRVRLWPEPPKVGAVLLRDTLGEVIDYVKHGELNLSSIACRDLARLMFDRVETEIETAIKKTHYPCTEFTKFLPPRTDLMEWVRWCPALVAKFRWHIHWGFEADWYVQGYFQDSRAYWEAFRQAVQPFRFNHVFDSEIREKMTGEEAVNIFLAVANAVYVPRLRETYLTALQSAIPEQRMDGVLMAISGRGLRHSPDPSILLYKDADGPSIDLAWSTMLYNHCDIESAIAGTSHSVNTTKIVRDAVDSLWEQYENARRGPNVLSGRSSRTADIQEDEPDADGSSATGDKQ